MFNSVEELYRIALEVTKDSNCNVAIGKRSYTYYLEIRWYQSKQARGYNKSFSEEMITQSVDVENFILSAIFKELSYNVGKIAYEEG